jgi:hypothetical protein
VALADASSRKEETFADTVRCDGLFGVGRTAGVEATIVTQKGTKARAVTGDKKNDEFAHGIPVSRPVF